MAKAKRLRTWIKIYPQQCLQGSIRWQLSAAERGVWYDLLNLAALQPTPGIIADSDGRAVPDWFIAQLLNISVDLLEQTLEKCEKEGRIERDDTGIRIVNWNAYQGNYEKPEKYNRQRQQRNQNKLPEEDHEWF